MAKLDPIAEFREDHRKVRDGLLEIIDAYESKGCCHSKGSPGKLNPLVGSHFRYEAVSLKSEEDGIPANFFGAT